MVPHYRSSFCHDCWYLKAQVWPKHLLASLLLQAVEGLLEEEVREETIWLHLGCNPGILAQCGQLLLHQIVTFGLVSSSKVFQDNSLSKHVHHGLAYYLP